MRQVARGACRTASHGAPSLRELPELHARLRADGWVAALMVAALLLPLGVLATAIVQAVSR